MTAVIGFANHFGAWIAGDGLTTQGDRRFPSDSQKILLLKDSEDYPMLIGVSGLSSVSKWLARNFVPPVKGQIPAERYLDKLFVPALYTCLTEGHIGLKCDDDYTVLLIGLDNRLFMLNYEYVAQAIESGVYAIGSGTEMAIGAFSAFRMSTTRLGKRSFVFPEECLLESVRITAEWNVAIGPPFTVGYAIGAQTNALYPQQYHWRSGLVTVQEDWKFDARRFDLPQETSPKDVERSNQAWFDDTLDMNHPHR